MSNKKKQDQEQASSVNEARFKVGEQNNKKGAEIEQRKEASNE